MVNIFISHRHDDRAIADQVRSALQEWCPKDTKIFQSSAPGRGIRGGDNILEALLDEIRLTDFFILLFTTADENWSYCMWELGAATAADTRDTTIALFQCTDHAPTIRTECKNFFATEEDSILDFTRSFHNEPSFLVPDDGARGELEPFFDALRRDEETIAKRAQSLHEALKDKIPNAQPRYEWRLDLLNLNVDAETAEAIRNSTDASLIDKVANGVKVKIDSSPGALEVFGRRSLQTETPLEALIDSWRKDLAESDYAAENETSNAEDWLMDFCADLQRSLDSRSSRRYEHWLRGANGEGLYKPIIARRRLKLDDSLDLEVILYKRFSDKQ